MLEKLSFLIEVSLVSYIGFLLNPHFIPTSTTTVNIGRYYKIDYVLHAVLLSQRPADIVRIFVPLYSPHPPH